jgi:plasmid stabilization system protein ParE
MNPLGKGALTGIIFHIAVFDSSRARKYYKELEVENKKRGKFLAYLHLIKDHFGPDRKYLQLVDETRRLVDKKREERDAPARPIYLPRETYLKE